LIFKHRTTRLILIFASTWPVARHPASVPSIILSTLFDWNNFFIYIWADYIIYTMAGGAKAVTYTATSGLFLSGSYAV